ncbi:MAG TPA: hypothetical protein VFV67_18605 [Actinophytocola sp.]|uniref:hypothetical protein n=1 Tax=Actinophytocola sp. TaxID=1872138 RepID=UPI002DB853E8|nr:hypothetical protein [Actinophytocola sp.]HEU5472662.1 hypothetical protein [Actinophytocola sp.]
MPNGYEVDVATVRAAAEQAAEVAGLVRPLAGQLGKAVGEVAAGAPGSRSAAMAEAAGQRWPKALDATADRIVELGNGLAESAKSYLAVDQAAARLLEAAGLSAAAAGGPGGRIGSVLDG